MLFKQMTWSLSLVKYRSWLYFLYCSQQQKSCCTILYTFFTDTYPIYLLITGKLHVINPNYMVIAIGKIRQLALFQSIRLCAFVVESGRQQLRVNVVSGVCSGIPLHCCVGWGFSKQERLSLKLPADTTTPLPRKCH